MIPLNIRVKALATATSVIPPKLLAVYCHYQYCHVAPITQACQITSVGCVEKLYTGSIP